MRRARLQSLCKTDGSAGVPPAVVRASCPRPTIREDGFSPAEEPQRPEVPGASAPEVRFLRCNMFIPIQLRPQLARFLVLCLFAFASWQPVKAATACVPFSEARNHIGATRCITGKVLRVQQGNAGVHFFDF